MTGARMLSMYICVYLRDLPWAYSKMLDEERNVDYAADHEPIGVEFLNVSHGVNVDDLPEQEAISHLLKEHNVKVFA